MSCLEGEGEVKTRISGMASPVTPLHMLCRAKMDNSADSARKCLIGRLQSNNYSRREERKRSRRGAKRVET